MQYQDQMVRSKPAYIGLCVAIIAIAALTFAAENTKLFLPVFLFLLTVGFLLSFVLEAWVWIIGNPSKEDLESADIYNLTDGVEGRRIRDFVAEDRYPGTNHGILRWKKGWNEARFNEEYSIPYYN